MPTGKFTNEIIEAAIHGFEAQKKRLDEQIGELRAMLTGAPRTPVAEPKAHKTRRKISPAALQRMREGQQRRWAKIRGESIAVPAKASAPKRKISAAGRKAIAEAQRKRWAAKKATSA